MIIKGYELRMTCGMCPEQYDVYKDGVKVGYFRLRHGCFSAEFPDCGWYEVFYSEDCEGDGAFIDDKERELFLTKAVDALDDFIETNHAYPPNKLLRQH